MPNLEVSESSELERHWPETEALHELRLQREFLSFLRVTAVNKVAGLSREQAITAPIRTSPSLTLLGVLKHLTAVERFWLCIVGGRSDLPSLWEGDDPEADWRIRPEDTPVTVVHAYRSEWVRVERLLAGALPDARCAVDADGSVRTVRWLHSHVIQETARHVGHMDLLRELVDGTKGE